LPVIQIKFLALRVLYALTMVTFGEVLSEPRKLWRVVICLLDVALPTEGLMRAIELQKLSQLTET
jgi:hypothetical protein